MPQASPFIATLANLYETWMDTGQPPKETPEPVTCAKCMVSKPMDVRLWEVDTGMDVICRQCGHVQKIPATNFSGATVIDAILVPEPNKARIKDARTMRPEIWGAFGAIHYGRDVSPINRALTLGEHAMQSIFDGSTSRALFWAATAVSCLLSSKHAVYDLDLALMSDLEKATLPGTAELSTIPRLDPGLITLPPNHLKIDFIGFAFREPGTQQLFKGCGTIRRFRPALYVWTWHRPSNQIAAACMELKGQLREVSFHSDLCPVKSVAQIALTLIIKIAILAASRPDLISTPRFIKRCKVGPKKNRRVVELWQPRGIGQNYKTFRAAAIHQATRSGISAPPRLHFRQAHQKKQRYGPGLSQWRTIEIPWNVIFAASGLDLEWEAAP